MGDVQAEIELLREENRQLKEKLTPRFNFPIEWQLNSRQRRALACLLSADEVSWERLALAAYGWNYPDKVALNGFIFSLRRKAAGFGLQLETMREFGYRLIDRQMWRQKLKIQ